MNDKKFSTKDYILVVLSLVLFAAAIFTIVMGLPYAAIGCFCIFACLTISLVQSVANKPVPQATETEEYIQLKKQYDETKRVSDVRINLLTAKVEESMREKDFLHKQCDSTTAELEEIKKTAIEKQEPEEKAAENTVENVDSMEKADPKESADFRDNADPKESADSMEKADPKKNTDSNETEIPEQEELDLEITEVTAQAASYGNTQEKKIQVGGAV